MPFFGHGPADHKGGCFTVRVSWFFRGSFDPTVWSAFMCWSCMHSMHWIHIWNQLHLRYFQPKHKRGTIHHKIQLQPNHTCNSLCVGEFHPPPRVKPIFKPPLWAAPILKHGTDICHGTHITAVQPKWNWNSYLPSKPRPINNWTHSSKKHCCLEPWIWTPSVVLAFFLHHSDQCLKGRKSLLDRSQGHLKLVSI